MSYVLLLLHLAIAHLSTPSPRVCMGGLGADIQAEEKYGTPAWNRKWSLLEGDGELVWVSPPSHSSFLVSPSVPSLPVSSHLALASTLLYIWNKYKKETNSRARIHSSRKRVKIKYAIPNWPGRSKSKMGYPYLRSYIRVH